MKNNKYLKKATEISNYLLKERVEIDNEVGWLGMNPSPVDNLFSFMNLSSELYDGNIGIVLTLLYSYKYTKNDKYLKVVVALLEQAKEEFYFMANSGYFETLKKRFKISPHTSSLSFPFCILFLMDHISTVAGNKYWDEQLYLALTKWIEDNTNDDSWNDVLLGTGGAILELINLLKKFPSKRKYLVELIESLAIQLTKSAKSSDDKIWWVYIEPMDLLYPEKELGGFAHGTAGMALVFASVYQLIDKDIFKETTIKAYNHDQSFYVEGIRGWQDNREKFTTFDGGSWCHGSTGIGLSRLVLKELKFLEYTRIHDYDEYLQIALSNSLEKSGTISSSQCLCHGDLGNFEVSLAISRHLKNKKKENETVDKINIVTNKKLHEFRHGGKMENAKMPGLFTGLSGIAYNCLRFYDWQKMPSILALEGPLTNYKFLHQ